MPGKKRSPIQHHRGLSGDLPPGSPVWVYLRHSPGEEQTIDSQREALEHYITEKQLVVLKWWIDEAKHGGLIESRDAFQAMLAASLQRPQAVVAIIVWDLSRFSRDILEAQFFLSDLRIRGYQVISVHDDVPSGEFGPIFESLLIWKNHRFLQDLSANVRRGHDTTINSVAAVDGKRITGFSCGGPAPVGYQAARIIAGTKPSGRPRYLVYWEKTADEDLRDRVQMAWRMAVDDARAGRTVEVVRIHKATHAHKSLSTYYHFFKSPTYKGTRHVGERLVDGAHEGYVPPEEWALVQAHMPKGRRSPLAIHPRRVNSPFLLSGRVVCGYCGSRLDYEADNRTPHYSALRCAGRKTNLSSCSLSKLSHRAFMEELSALLSRELFTEDRLRALVEASNDHLAESRAEMSAKRKALERQISVASRAIDRLLDALEQGEEIGAVRDRLQKRQEEKAVLAGELARLALHEAELRPVRLSRNAYRTLARGLKEALASGDPELVRPVLQGVVGRIVVWNDKARVEYSLHPRFLPDSTLNFRAMNGRARGDSNPRSPA